MLEEIHSPADLRALAKSDLPTLAEELREFVICNTAQTGGHLASNLGVIELAIALHYVFDTPNAKLIWDVGHQAYAHKILTGRKTQMPTLRQKDGISGFPRRLESEFDAFGVGHSSTSISAALGMARAFALKNKAHDVIAVIGDGALSAGMAFEAMNNVGPNDNILVILNDNDMSISKPVGALNTILTRITSGKTFNAARAMGKQVLRFSPALLEFAKRTEEHVKGMISPATLFEEFGFNYFGPIDGHDLNLLVTTLTNLKATKGPKFLHVMTQKGHGYKKAEEEPTRYHGVSTFNVAEGLPDAAPKKEPTFTDLFGAWLVEKAQNDENCVAITPAMCEGSGLVDFRAQFPNRYFDVGIAEQHALTFAAGLACEGIKPVVAIYSTFLQRAYDQLIHDIALQNLPVMLAVDRAGPVGADGATHHGNFDLSFALCVPNLSIFTPADANDFKTLLNTAYALKSPALIRYPRGLAPDFEKTHGQRQKNFKTHAIIKHGTSGVAVLVFGVLLFEALKAVADLNVTLVNMRIAKPLDADFLKELARTHSRFLTIEDNAATGGAGAYFGQFLRQNNITAERLEILGLPDQFIEHGTQSQIFAAVGLNSSAIFQHLKELL